MARPLRLSFPGAIYHVMARGNAKGLIFLDDVDREKFLATLEDVVFRFELECWAYCLMPNHYHLVLRTPSANLSAAVKHLNGVYSQWWNFRHGRCGHVFQGRFKAQLVQRERYLAAVCRYVVLNPVRAGLVATPDEWNWSSFRASARASTAPPFLDLTGVDSLFANLPGSRPGNTYRKWVAGPDEIADVQRLVRSDVRFIGDEGFLEDERHDAELGLPRAIPNREIRCSFRSLFELFGGVTSRSQRDGRIRVAIDTYGYRPVTVARHLRLSLKTVKRARQREATPAVVCGHEVEQNGKAAQRETDIESA